MSYAVISKIWRFATYAYAGLLLVAYAWMASEDAVRDPRKPLFFVLALLLVGASFGLHRRRGRRFLLAKIGFAACLILCFVALKYFHLLTLWRDGPVYQFLTWLAVFPFVPDRPPRGPWWPAAKRTMRMFRGDSREDDAEHAAKILASFRQANTPQK